MLLDVAVAIDAFGSTYTVRRTPARALDANGRLVAAAPTTFPIHAVIQPLLSPQDDNYQEPEGDYGADIIVIFTRTEIDVSNDVYEADQVEYKGSWYKLASQDAWDEHGGYYRCTAKLDQV